MNVSVSTASLVWFILIVALVAAIFTAALAAAGSGAEPIAQRRRWRLLAVGLVAATLGLSAAAASSGLLARFSARPPPLFVYLASATVATTLLAFSPVGTRLVQGFGLGALVGFQFFRLPLELLLHRLYREGVVPVQMTYSGYNFDAFSGLFALGIGLLALRRVNLRRGIYTGWNLLGLATLTAIVTIAMLSTPTALRAFPQDPANTFVASLPFVWLPAFLVQAAWFGHLLVFRKLAATR